MDEVNNLEHKISTIRNELEVFIIKSKVPYEEILEISRELDKLIVLYYKLTLNK